MIVKYLTKECFEIQVFERLMGDGTKQYFPKVIHKYKWLWKTRIDYVVRFETDPDGSKFYWLVESGGFFNSTEFKSIEEAKEAAEIAIAKHLKAEIQNTVVHYKKVYP